MDKHSQHQQRTHKPQTKTSESTKPSPETAGVHQGNLSILNRSGLTSGSPLDPRTLNQHQILDLQRTVGNHAVMRMLQREETSTADPESAPVPTLTPEQIERRNLAQSVLNAIDERGGLNVAVYLVNWNKDNDPKTYENDDEFKTQAVQYAQDHLSFGVSDNKLMQGVAMGIDKSVAERMTQVVEKANALLDEFPDLYTSKPSVKVETLSVFTHGEATILEAGAKRKKDGKDRTSWIGPSTFVKGMAENLSTVVTVNLYACSAAGVVKVGDNFATAVQQKLQAELTAIHGFAEVEVWGHTSGAHSTYNPNLVGVAPDLFGENTEGNLKEELSKRLMLSVMSAAPSDLDEKDQKKLAEKARSVIARTLIPVDITYVKGEDGKEKKEKNWRTGPADPLNTYFREITALGIERVWQDLTAASDPSDYSSLGLTPEAQERMVRGIQEFRERFKPGVAELQAEAARLMEASAETMTIP